MLDQNGTSDQLSELLRGADPGNEIPWLAEVFERCLQDTTLCTAQPALVVPLLGCLAQASVNIVDYDDREEVYQQVIGMLEALAIIATDDDLNPAGGEFGPGMPSTLEIRQAIVQAFQQCLPDLRKIFHSFPAQSGVVLRMAAAVARATTISLYQDEVLRELIEVCSVAELSPVFVILGRIEPSSLDWLAWATANLKRVNAASGHDARQVLLLVGSACLLIRAGRLLGLETELAKLAALDDWILAQAIDLSDCFDRSTGSVAKIGLLRECQNPALALRIAGEILRQAFDPTVRVMFQQRKGDEVVYTMTRPPKPIPLLRENKLEPLQAAALDAMVRSPALFGQKTNLLRLWGLPDSRSALHDWLGPLGG